MKKWGGHVKSRTHVVIWAACAKDEVATETVFSSLLKGQLPGYGTFEKLKRLDEKVIHEDQETGEDQTLK